MKLKAIIVDIDGTLANCDHRRKFVERPCDCCKEGEFCTSNNCAKSCNSRKPKDWESFFRRMGLDDVNEWCRDIVIKYAPTHKIILITGRPEKYRETTSHWLTSNHIPFAELHMRPNEKHSDDDRVKEKIYVEEIKNKYDVTFVIDDRPKVIRMWRRLGLPCLDCGDGVEF